MLNMHWRNTINFKEAGYATLIANGMVMPESVLRNIRVENVEDRKERVAGDVKLHTSAPPILFISLFPVYSPCFRTRFEFKVFHEFPFI